MIYPTIHMNGTSANMLKEGYLEAHRAIKDAADKVCAVEFNARDYYVAGPDAWTQAREEHNGRINRLHAVADELMQILEHIQTNIDEKERRERERTKY